MATANTIHVDIVSAEGEIFSGAASMVFAPGSQGDLGIAPRHAPLLTLLKAGEVRVQTPDGAEQHFFVGGGALEVQPTRVTVLADTIRGFKGILAGEYDHLPEQAFYMVGNIEEAVEKAKTLN